MKWEIQVDGPAEDLRLLVQSLNDENIGLIERDNAFHLESSKLNALCTPDEVKTAAEELLQILTGAARMALGMRKPIKVAFITKIDSQGRKNTFAYLSDTAHVRVSAYGTIRTSDGEEVAFRPADPIPRWMELAKVDLAVAKALRLVGSGVEGWVELYRLFEVIESDSGGIEGIVSLGWAQKGRLKEFKHTANSPGAVGDLARHGTEDTMPPKNPMDLSDAKALVMSLLHDWIRSK